MGKAPPSFQFYAADFAEGTDDMTLAEVGGYTRLLCSQWAKGSVPGDQPTKLAVIMRCTPATAKSVWKAIGSKFEKGDDGQYRNARLERERQKQQDYRRLQAERGKASAAKRNAGSTEPLTPVQPSGQPEGQPEVNPKPGANSLSLSSSSEKIISQSPAAVISTPSARPSAAPPPLAGSHLDRERRLAHCAFVGSRVEVPKSQHWQFRRAIGGMNPDPELLAWYETLNAAVETSGEEIPVGTPLLKWLDQKFQAWRATAATSVGEAEFLRGA